MRQSNVLAPVIDLKRGSAVDDRQISDTPPHIAAVMKVNWLIIGIKDRTVFINLLILQPYWHLLAENVLCS